MKTLKILSALALLFIMLMPSCKKQEESQKGEIAINFIHHIDGELLEVDALKYSNAAQNPYMINEIQYFISNVILYKEGKEFTSTPDNFSHYVDTDIADSYSWLNNDFESNKYDSLKFTFGFDQEHNISRMFTNPPESHMFWPDLLGGGFHYMKLNGKWIPAKDALENPFNFHLGIGQIYTSIEPHPDSVSEFVHNDFSVVYNKPFQFDENDSLSLSIIMNIEQWFMEPNIYDFNYFGGKIMQNQEAMNAACENGRNVFSVVVQ